MGARIPEIIAFPVVPMAYASTSNVIELLDGAVNDAVASVGSVETSTWIAVLVVCNATSS